MKKSLFAALIIMNTFILSQGKGLEVGSSAPQLTAINQDNQTIDLGAVFKEGLTLIYFYPKADTPGCTAQACSLRDDYDSLVDQGITVLGVSYDSPEDQKKFQQKYSLPFDLIADQDKAVSNAFDRKGFFSRQAYLIKDGTIVWRDLKASTRGQATDVEKAIESLGL